MLFVEDGETLEEELPNLLWDLYFSLFSSKECPLRWLGELFPLYQLVLVLQLDLPSSEYPMTALVKETTKT